MVIATTEILNGSVMLKSICFNCDSDWTLFIGLKDIVIYKKLSMRINHADNNLGDDL